MHFFNLYISLLTISLRYHFSALDASTRFLQTCRCICIWLPSSPECRLYIYFRLPKFKTRKKTPLYQGKRKNNCIVEDSYLILIVVITDSNSFLTRNKPLLYQIHSVFESGVCLVTEILPLARKQPYVLLIGRQFH